MVGIRKRTGKEDLGLKAKRCKMPSALTENMLFHQHWLLNMMHTYSAALLHSNVIEKLYRNIEKLVIRRNRIAVFIILSFLVGLWKAGLFCSPLFSSSMNAKFTLGFLLRTSAKFNFVFTF